MRKLLTVLLLLALLLVAATPALAVTGQTPSGLSFSEMETQIDALMDEHIGVSTPGAAIAVVYEGEIVFSRGYGWADISNRIQVDPAATVFEYGSINKTFVWVAVMRLVEQGLLSLDVDVRSYLPDTFMFKESFTMRDLLNHSAGFEDFLLGMICDARTIDHPGSLEETLLDLQPRQIYTPGTVSAYSNWGAALAAFIVERVSGQDYATFERENILIPSNMQNTLNQPEWLGNDAFLAKKATGYSADGEGGFKKSMWSYVPSYPAGAMNGTAEDLASFVIALTPSAGESGPLFSYADTLETLFTPSSTDPLSYPGTHHGFLLCPGALPAFGHSGGTAAFIADFVVVPETRFGFVLLTNGTLQELTIPIHEILLGSAQSEIKATPGGLPGTKAVEGRFLPARRYGGNFVEFFSYAGLANLPIVRVSALDENKIRLSVGADDSAVYVQTEPYVYSFDSSDSPFFAHYLPRLRFHMEDGLPRRIHIGDGSDLTSLPAGRTMPFLIGSLIIVALCVAFFIIAPVVLFFLFLIRRKKRKARTLFDRFSACFLLSGTLLALNNLLLFSLFGISPFHMAADVAYHIWINYALASLSALLLAGSIWSWRRLKEERTKRKVLFIITAVFTVLFIVVLLNWHFFVLI